MNFTEIFNGMVGKDFIVAFNDNFRITNNTFLSILATLLYKVKSTDIKEFKVIDGVVSYTMEDEPEEGAEDTRTWTPVDITAWGNITGSIADQADLKAVLDSKAALDTVVELSNILSTLRGEFNNLRNNYEDTELVVEGNTNDIADLTESNRTKVSSTNIKAIRVSDAEFQWTVDGITWYSMARTTSVSWGNITGNITSQDDLMTLFRNIDTDMTALSSTVSNLSNEVASRVSQIEGLSDAVDSLTEDLSNAQAANLSKFNNIDNEITDLGTADTTLDAKIDNHIADDNNPHNVTKTQVGLDQVDNTSDQDKPLSTAQKDYIDTAIGNVNQRFNNYLGKSGRVTSLFVGVESEYQNITPTNVLGFILWNDWQAAIINQLTISSTGAQFSGDIILKNIGGGKYDGKKFTSTFTTGAETTATITNIPEGSYACYAEYPYTDGTISGTNLIVRSSTSITVGPSSTLDLAAALNPSAIEYLENIMLWVESGITITSITSAVDGRTLSQAPTTIDISGRYGTNTPLTGYSYYIAQDPLPSTDQYISGVVLGDYEIRYSKNGTDYTKTVNVSRQTIMTPIIISEGGNN